MTVFTCVNDDEGCKARELGLCLMSEVESKVVSWAQSGGKGDFEETSVLSSSFAGQMFSFKKHFDDLELIIVCQLL